MRRAVTSASDDRGMEITTRSAGQCAVCYGEYFGHAVADHRYVATQRTAPVTRAAKAAQRAASKLCSACGLPATSAAPGLCRYHGPEGRG